MATLLDFITSEAYSDLGRLREILRDENVDAQDDDGRTALHHVILKIHANPGDTDIILRVAQELLVSRADVDSTDTEGRSPLHFAVGFRNCKIIELLLRWDATVNERSFQQGFAPLHIAVMRFEYENRVYDPECRVVSLLLRYNADVNVLGLREITPLGLAARENQFEILKELINNGADMDRIGSNGYGAIHYAFDQREIDLDIVTELLRRRCNLFFADRILINPMTLYFRRLQVAPPAEIVKAKLVFKFYLLRVQQEDIYPARAMARLIMRNVRQLHEFLRRCSVEIEQMRRDILHIEPDVSAFDIAMRGVYNQPNQPNNDFNHYIVYRRLAVKLARSVYPVYSDIIISGICRPFINSLFADVCFGTGGEFEVINYDNLYVLSFNLSHFDMLNAIIACWGRNVLRWAPENNLHFELLNVV